MPNTTSPARPYRVAILFPADPELRRKTRLQDSRFARTAAALADIGMLVEGAPYFDDDADDVRAQLMQVDGVLVWINPIVEGRDRTVLNALLGEVASTGVLVSAHPDVIAKMGTKEVLYRTRTMGWGCDTRHYPNLQAMRAELPACLASGPRVLKQMRGHSGDGVWKVELVSDEAVRAATALSLDTGVRVRQAKRGSVETRMSLVRCYLVGNRVAGFGEQLVNALCPAPPGASVQEAPLPGPRLYYPPTRPDFQRLKDMLEQEGFVRERCCLGPGLSADGGSEECGGGG